MTGLREEYHGSVFSTVLKIPEIDMFSAGNFSSSEGEVLISRDDHAYRKLILKDGEPVGTIILGDSKAMVAAMRVFDGTSSPEILIEFFE